MKIFQAYPEFRHKTHSKSTVELGTWGKKLQRQGNSKDRHFYNSKSNSERNKQD